jgi:hypothetical protein
MSMGIKRILLKLVDDIPEDLPTHSPKRTGSISGFSTYQVGFASVLDNGIEISMGLINLLENYLWFIIYAEFISVSHLELH